MAIKQRLLARLQALENTMLHAMETGTRETWGAVCQELAATKEQCRQGMPESGFFAYGEIYDGLILVTQQILADATVDACQEVSSLCMDLLQNLIGETEREKRFKKEFVFLPYKSSMWDSLESVWKAAVEDKEHCNAYVIPIPYADLNPDRSAAEWHVEHDFPSYVPILDWQSIDLKAMHPDAIFIHNAYDDSNLVTSVDSRYYSRNLKDITDKLVYIPYSVDEEVQPGNEAVEESISNRVLQPGVLNAHLVIAQSEDTRQAWINILVRHTNMKDRSYWEGRILGLGSPKIDKVLTSKREDFALPEKWKRLVEGRKVILYNTSLGTMLQNTDKVCDKLRYVFDVFRDRKDVVLWWRPHPLMKATFHSMRPQFAEEYLSLEKQYIEEGWGIYDDSSDLHRAICWSDAYYGDYSSVMVLYEKTNKLAVYQVYDEGKLQRLISMVDVQEHEGKLFFSAWNVNGIFSYDLNTYTISRVTEFPDYPLYHSMDTSGLFERVERIEEILYFIPYGAKQMYSYNLRNGLLKKTHIDILEKGNSWNISYGREVVNGDDIWLIPSRGKTIVRYRCKHEDAILYEKWHDDLDDEELKRNIAPWFLPGPVLNEKLWMLAQQTNVLCEFDIISGRANTYHVGSDQYMSIAYDGEKFWLLSTQGDLYWWDRDKDTLGCINNVLDGDGWAMVYREGKIFAFKCHSPNYAVVDVHSLEVQHVSDYLFDGWICYTSVILKENIIYILPNIGNVIVRIMEDFRNPEVLPIKLMDGFKEYYQKEIFDGVINESEIWDLPFILDQLIVENNPDKDIRTGEVNVMAGKKIIQLVTNDP